MKRLSFTVLALLAGFTAVFGQFTNPSFPETSYPTAAMQQMARTNHTSCYSMVGNQSTSPGNLYVYSWSGFGGGGNPPDKDKGIAWIRRNPNNSAIINQGIIPGLITQYIADIDVALYDDGGYSYIIAGYYLFDPAGINNGHYLNIYRWQAGGPVLVGSPIRLSHPAGYGRISIDAHDRRAVAVVWQEDNSIKILTGKADPASINANGITFANILDIYNAANGTIPDVAFQQTGTTDGTIDVRIVYVDNAGNFVVSYERWAQLELQPSPGINFLIEDTQPAPLSYYDPSLFLPLQYGSELIIDCPDHYAYRNWTYTYISDDGISARVMSKFDSPTASTYNLSNGSIFGVDVNSYLNLYPAVAYDQNGSMMHIGWLSRYPNSGYIAVHLKENGNYVTQNYQIINGTPDVSPTSPLSFSKETSPLLPIDNLFTVYPMTSTTGGYYMKSKLIPWSSNSFRPSPTTTAETTISNNATVEAYPNPYSKTFSLSISNDDGETTYALLISNISGKEIMHIDGTLQQINSKLSNVSASLSSGFYLLNIKTATSNQTIKVVKN